MKVKQGQSVTWLFLKINLSTAISMKRSRRELSFDMVIHGGILKKQITLFPCFTFIPKTHSKNNIGKTPINIAVTSLVYEGIIFSARLYGCRAYIL